MGPGHRAQEVVGGFNAGHPVPHRIVDGIFESPGAGRDRHNFSPEQSHPCHIEGLAFSVNFPHVDHAAHPHQRCGRRSSDTVLPRSCFGD